ncbi:MAG: hypothetical protein KDA75_16645 [Planctomycetaceae bacterium]|nr:hypothetical protein [Planctomycetaceae bacterium]
MSVDSLGFTLPPGIGLSTIHVPANDSQRNCKSTLPAGSVERSEGRGRGVGVAVWKVLITLSPPRLLSRLRRGSDSDT